MSISVFQYFSFSVSDPARDLPVALRARSTDILTDKRVDKLTYGLTDKLLSASHIHNERTDHPFQFNGQSVKSLIVRVGQKPQAVSEFQMVFKLAR